ncbi:unnamed protein product [Ceutorhynchus assimilis]|uniref:Ig-like domain-containing protein n=1 Tax=Ceutorhynchus assimilis TaxID=467358 RepID=A0A9P0GSD3_9CUCU|nr:unnamed protein product [Ceutorhynchus assimilis]
MEISPSQWILIMFSTFIIGMDSLKEIEISIPVAVRVRDTISLQCKYDLEGEPLYTVKWYKGTKEFFRFVPKELPNTKVFALPGIDVDLSKSTPNEVVLRNVQPEVTGRYKCEVSSDAPYFDTKWNSGYIYVIDAPLDDPSLLIEKNYVDVGDFITGNCTTLPSYPATNVSWYLNGKRIPERFSKKLEVTPEFMSSRRKHYVTMSGIELQIMESTFQNGKAFLSCVASLFNIYRGERKEVLEEAKPRPRPSSVLSSRDERSGGQQLEILPTLIVLVFLLIIYVHR